jgi:hypothetical protein
VVGPTRTAFAKSGELHIAHQVVGDGPIDMILVPSGFGHLDRFPIGSSSSPATSSATSFRPPTCTC